MVLRHIDKATDTDTLLRILANPKNMEFVFDGPLTGDKARDFLDRFAESDEQSKRFKLGVLCSRSRTLEGDGRQQPMKIIGFAGLLKCEDFGLCDDLEFGLVIDEGERRKGWSEEISRRLIAYAFNDANRSRVLAECHPDNHASRNLLETKLAMRLIAEIPAKGKTGLRRVYELRAAT